MAGAAGMVTVIVCGRSALGLGRGVGLAVALDEPPPPGLRPEAVEAWWQALAPGLARTAAAHVRAIEGMTASG